MCVLFQVDADGPFFFIPDPWLSLLLPSFTPPPSFPLFSKFRVCPSGASPPLSLFSSFLPPLPRSHPGRDDGGEGQKLPETWRYGGRDVDAVMSSNMKDDGGREEDEAGREWLSFQKNRNRRRRGDRASFSQHFLLLTHPSALLLEDLSLI